MALNLGDITFSLGANTAGLRAALNMLSQFSQATNRAAASTAEGAAAMAAAYNRQEHAVRAALQQLEQLRAAYQRQGGNANVIAQMDSLFTHLTQTMTTGVVEAERFTRANDLWTASIGRAKRALQEEADAARNSSNALNLRARAQVMGTGAASSAAAFGASVNRAGAPSAISADVNRALRDYQNVLNSSTASLQDMQQAQANYNAALSTGRVELANWSRAQQTAASASAGMAAQQTKLAAATQRVLDLNSQIERAKGPAELILQNNKALRDYEIELRAAGNSATAMAAAQTKLNAALGQSRRAFADFKGDVPESVRWLRQLQAASILAYGPLGGVASRIAALAALTDRSSLAFAAMIGGVTGVAYGFGKLAMAAVDTEKQMQGILNTLAAGSGSMTLAKNDFEFLTIQSERLGLNLMDTAQQYAAFSVAAAQTNIAGRDARNIFIGLTEAMTAMHRPSTDISSALLALQQMLSKGKVQSQELVLQLGNALPGAMQLAAKAMGKTTAELQKLLETGQLRPEEFLTSLGDYLHKTFGDDAARAADSIIGAQNRLSSAIQLFNKSLNDAVNASGIYKAALNGMANAIKFLSDHLTTLLPLIGAVGAALVTYFVAPAIVVGLRAIISAFETLRLVMMGVSIAGAVTTGGLVGMIAAAAVGIGVFLALGNAMKGATSDQDRFNEELDQYIHTSKLAGSASKGLTNEYINESTRRLGALAIEKEAQQEIIDQITERQKQIANGSLTNRGDVVNASRLKQASDRIAEINQQMDNYKAKITVLQTIPAFDNKPVEKMAKSTQSLLDKITETQAALEQNKLILSQMPSATTPEQIEQAKQYANAVGDVQKLSRASADDIIEVGKALGITGIASVAASERIQMITDHLTALYTSLGLTKEQITKLEQELRNTPKVMDDFNHAIQQTALETAALEQGPIAFRDWQHSIKNANSELYKFQQQLAQTTLSKDKQEELLGFMQTVQEANIKARAEFDNTAKTINQIADKIVGAFDGVGDAISSMVFTGKAEIKDLKQTAQDFLAELLQMILQVTLLDQLKTGLQDNLPGIIKGVGSWFGSLFSTPQSQWQSTTGNPHFGARGLATSGGRVIPMAKGNILTTPTVIPMANGNIAVAREAMRDEGVFPLSRMSNGDLGINAKLGGGDGRMQLDINLLVNGQKKGQTSVDSRKQGGGGKASMSIMLDELMADTLNGKGKFFGAMRETFGLNPRARGSLQ